MLVAGTGKDPCIPYNPQPHLSLQDLVENEKGGFIMKKLVRLASVVTVMLFIAVPFAQGAQKKIDNSKQKVEQPGSGQSGQQLSTSAESHDPHWRPHKHEVDFVITEVLLIRHPDLGNISVGAHIKNIGDKSTAELIRVKLGNYGYVWIHGLRKGETKSTGLTIDDNAHHNRAVGPVTVVVNGEGEIAERNTRNNTCTGSRLSSTENHSVHHCPY